MQSPDKKPGAHEACARMEGGDSRVERQCGTLVKSKDVESDRLHATLNPCWPIQPWAHC